MDGTALETPPQRIEGEDEPIIFSFFSDITQIPVVSDLFLNISQNTQKTLLNALKLLTRWKRYRPLWQADKVNLSIYFNINTSHKWLNLTTSDVL